MIPKSSGGPLQARSAAWTPAPSPPADDDDDDLVELDLTHGPAAEGLSHAVKNYQKHHPNLMSQKGGSASSSCAWTSRSRGEGGASRQMVRFSVPRSSRKGNEPPSPPSEAHMSDPSSASRSGGLRYLSVSDEDRQRFQEYARSLTTEASRQAMINNPYVQALYLHRQEMQKSVQHPEHQADSLAARLATSRSGALATLENLDGYSDPDYIVLNKSNRLPSLLLAPSTCSHTCVQTMATETVTMTPRTPLSTESTAVSSGRSEAHNSGRAYDSMHSSLLASDSPYEEQACACQGMIDQDDVVEVPQVVGMPGAVAQERAGCTFAHEWSATTSL